jgi:DNA segregation ATPase FtsK/SpoIIIE-like protein
MLSPDRTAKTAAKNGLARLLQRGRAVGVRLVLCTQTPNRDVVDKSIKHNLPNRIALKAGEGPHSMTLLGDYSAMDPDMAGEGRGILLYGGYKTKLQIPFIPDSIVRSAVEAVTNATDEPVTAPSQPQLSVNQVLRYSLDNMSGSLSINELFNEFRGRISNRELRNMLTELENERMIHIDDTWYEVVPGSGRSPRHLIELDVVEMDSESAAD